MSDAVIVMAVSHPVGMFENAKAMDGARMQSAYSAARTIAALLRKALAGIDNILHDRLRG